MKLVKYLNLFCLLFVSNISFSQDLIFTDGPYIINNRVIGQIKGESGLRIIDTIYNSLDNISFTVSNKDQDKEFIITPDKYIKHQILTPSVVKKDKTESLFIVSDSHGDFNQFCKLLNNNEIIDNNLNWTFGANSLIIIGDTFDRGEDVLSLLWYIVYLENQAKNAGGRIIYLLGNHDNMVLRGDLRYLAERYKDLYQELDMPYDSLFCEGSFLGNWLKYKNSIQIIGDNLITHGGISNQFIESGYSLDSANRIISDFLFSKKENYSSSAKFLFGTNGPLWYRGLVMDDEKYNPIKKAQLNKILKVFKIKRIIVGHTTFNGVIKHHKGKVISVDSKNKEREIPHLYEGLRL